MKFYNCTMLGNTAEKGGGFQVDGSIPYIDDNTIIQDNDANFYGSNILDYPNSLRLKYKNLTFYDNETIVL